jgi:CBS domain-containing protein
MKPKSENPASGVNTGLGVYDGAERLRLPAGQVLIYRGHQAPGVFVFLSGCISSGAREWRSKDAYQPFLVIPEVSALDSPLPESVTIEDGATALYIPRSLVLRELSVQQLLQIIASEWCGPELEQGGIVQSASDVSPNPLIIRKRTTIGGEGDVSIERTVHCLRQAGSVTIIECLRCDHCERIVQSLGGEPSELICDYSGVCVDDLVAVGGSPAEAARPSRVPISAIMTSDVVCVQKDLSVEVLAALFLERGFSGAPVVDESGRPIGVVSKTDLVRERHDDGDLEEREPPSACEGWEFDCELGPGFHAAPIARATVADIMMPIVFALPENATITKAASLMALEGVHRIPVVSAGGQVVGVLSSLDILCWLAGIPVGSSAAPGAVRNASDAQDPCTPDRPDCSEDGGPTHGM